MSDPRSASTARHLTVDVARGRASCARCGGVCLSTDVPTLIAWTQAHACAAGTAKSEARPASPAPAKQEGGRDR